jgi:ABC-type transport system involved in multi-copper enzyme maturation permease subunit
MVAAEILKLRRNRAVMATTLVLSLGITVLYFAVILSRHGGTLPGARSLSAGSTLLGLYFGSCAAILLGAEAGTADVTSGVFRDLAATGRSRAALFLARVPAAVAVALAVAACGFAVTVAAALAFGGDAPVPGPVLILQFAGWVALATASVTALSVGVGALTGSRALTLTAVIGWQTVAVPLLFSAGFLGSARDLLLPVAISHLRPGTAIGTAAHPGSTNALPAYILPMSAVAAVAVVLAWMVVPALAGAWRTRTMDA